MIKIAKSTEDIVKDMMDMSLDDYLGLWVIISIVRDAMRLSSEGDIKAMSLKIVGDIIDNGLKPGFLRKDGGFDAWSGSKDILLKRITDEWPNAGSNDFDACWFSNG